MTNHVNALIEWARARSESAGDDELIDAAVAAIQAAVPSERGRPRSEPVFESLPSGTDIAHWFKEEEWAHRFDNVGGDATWLSKDPHSHLWKLAEVDQDDQMFYLLDIGTAAPSDATGWPEGTHVHDLLFVTAGMRESLSCEWRNEPQAGQLPVDEAVEWFAQRCQAAIEHWAMIDARGAGSDPYRVTR